MTEIQELLLDKLVATDLGRNCQGGPFHIAAELLPGKAINFQGSHGEARGKRAIAGRLGYPLTLLEAVQGVAYLLDAEDDRRAFAIAIFRAIPPGVTRKPQAAEVTWRAAVAVTLRAHGLACPVGKCEMALALDALRTATREDVRRAGLVPFFATRCPTAGRTASKVVGLTRKSSGLDRTLHAARDCVRTYGGSMQVLYAFRAAREAARAACTVGGLEAAVGLCVELAQQLGIEAA